MGTGASHHRVGTYVRRLSASVIFRRVAARASSGRGAASELVDAVVRVGAYFSVACAGFVFVFVPFLHLVKLCV